MIRNKHESEHGDEGALRRYNSDEIDRNLLNVQKAIKDSLFTLNLMPRNT